MNVRKLFDWRKLLIYTHRWMGIVFGMVFVVWFVSGIAFIYVGMPSLSARERLGHMRSLDVSTMRLTPADAAQKNDLEFNRFTIDVLSSAALGHCRHRFQPGWNRSQRDNTRPRLETFGPSRAPIQEIYCSSFRCETNAAGSRIGRLVQRPIVKKI
jgi:hypothetical protein